MGVSALLAVVKKWCRRANLSSFLREMLFRLTTAPLTHCQLNVEHRIGYIYSTVGFFTYIKCIMQRNSVKKGNRTHVHEHCSVGRERFTPC